MINGDDFGMTESCTGAICLALRKGLITHTTMLANGVCFEQAVVLAREKGFVEKIGCELAQGFYFHKPAPLDDMLFRLRGGFQAKPCETSEERTEYRKLWTEEGDT